MSKYADDASPVMWWLWCLCCNASWRCRTPPASSTVDLRCFTLPSSSPGADCTVTWDIYLQKAQLNNSSFSLTFGLSKSLQRGGGGRRREEEGGGGRRPREATGDNNQAVTGELLLWTGSPSRDELVSTLPAMKIWTLWFPTIYFNMRSKTVFKGHFKIV